MYLPEIKLKIVRALRDGPLDQFQIAADTCEAPFRVRAELQDLRRMRLIRGPLFRSTAAVWELTDQGERIAHNADQLELGA